MKSTESWPLPFAESPVLDLDAGVIALDIFPVAAGEQPRLEPSHGRRSDGPAPQISVEDGTVRVKFEPLSFGWAPWSRGRHGNFQLFVPSNLRARIRCAAGQIRAQNLSGCDLDLATGAGQIALREVHGRLTLDTSAGEVRGERIGGTLQVEANLGSVRLEVDALDPGIHRIQSSMGSIRLSLIEGLKVRIDAQTSMGSTRNRYPSTPDAEAILSLETDLGSVRVDSGGSACAASGEDWRQSWGDENAWPAASGRHARHRAQQHARFARHGHHADRFRDPFGEPPDPPSPAAPAPPPPAPAAEASPDELKRILVLVEQGKINAAQASDLIQALQGR